MKKKQFQEKVKRDLDRDYESIKNGARNELSEVSRRYLKAIVDTKNAAKCGIPSAIGGYPGRTASVRYRQQLEVETGQMSVGFLSVNTSGITSSVNGLGLRVGPFNDTSNMCYTKTAYNNDVIPPSSGALPQGLATSAWLQSPYESASDANIAENLQWRTVGCTIEIYPTSSFSDQNGRIVLLEVPSHAVLNSTVAVPISALESFPTQRNIRAVQTGSQKEKIVINYHPRALSTAGGFESNDFDFHSLPFANSVPVIPQMPEVRQLLVGFFAKPGTSFHCDVTVMYELKGKQVPNIKPRLVDSRGMDLVMNTFSHKVVDGYVGVPEHVYESYLANAWHYAKKGFGWVTKNEKRIMDGAGRVARTLGGFI